MAVASTVFLPLFALGQPLKPLSIKAQGSFYVGGQKKRITEPATKRIFSLTGDITVNQMYVHYQLPLHDDEHPPVVMVHGRCLSSKAWETTPDGRMGWSEYFLRHDRPVYLADQVFRARSGFDPEGFYAARNHKAAAASMPGIEVATHQLAWTVFRVGPKFGEVFPDEQFPVQAMEEFYKQMIPDLNATLSDTPNPNWTNLAALAVKLGGAVLMAHSESGFYPERAALIAPNSVKGIVSIETQCATNLPGADLARLARIPTLVVFGDHLDEVTLAFARFGKWTWADMFRLCSTFVDQLKSAGGDAEIMHLPKLGMKGNSHMLMQDRNNQLIADRILAWMESHVESTTAHRGSRQKPAFQ